jgi:hypothetical protein
MSVSEMLKRIDEIYRQAEAEGREITDAELEEIDNYTDLIYGSLDE